MAKQATKTVVEIKPPNFETAVFKITGTAPLVINNFSAKARQQMKEAQEAGSAGKSKKKKDAKNFEEVYKGAFHVSREGWNGIPAAAFRAAMISACRLVEFKMTIAKMSVFVIADGYDNIDGTPLIKITKGTPEMNETPVRLPTGPCDIHPRPMWREWGAVVRVRFDADKFTVNDVTALMARAGMQVGVGEGRPDSPNSNGMGWGTFDLEVKKK